MFKKSKLLTALMCVGISVSAITAEAKMLRLSHNLPTDNPNHISLAHMATRVSELSGGDLEIMIFPNGQLGAVREAMEQVQNGLIDLTRTNASALEAFDETYSVLNLPYVFKSEDHFHKALSDQNISQEILMSSKEKGFVGLMFMFDGSRSFYANKEIRTPADLKGMKIRVQPSPSAIKMVQLLGGNPTPISFGELYSALQQGVVDGAENNPQALVDVRHGEVSKVYSKDEHTMIPGVLIISSMTWDKLTEQEKGYMQQAAKDTMAFHRKLYDEQTKKVVATATKDLSVKFVQVEKEPFVQAVLPMHEELASKSPKLASLLDQIKKSAD